jgi:hypothetical protein
MRDNPTLHLTWIQSKAKEHETISWIVSHVPLYYFVSKSSVKLDSLSCSFVLLCIQVKCKVGLSLMFLCLYKVIQRNMRDYPTLHLTLIQSNTKEHERQSNFTLDFDTK